MLIVPSATGLILELGPHLIEELGQASVGCRHHAAMRAVHGDDNGADRRMTRGQAVVARRLVSEGRRLLTLGSSRSDSRGMHANRAA